MSYLTQAQSADPATPAVTKNILFPDTANRRPVSLDDKGVRNVLTARALPNYLRNSGFWFAQRQAPATLTTYSSLPGGRSPTADGWAITNENASTQYIRTDTASAPESGLNGRFYGTFSKSTNTGKVFISQCLEGFDSLELRNRTVRFQVWLKASSVKTIKIAVVQLQQAGTLDAGINALISAVGANGVDPTLGANLAFLVPKAGVAGDNSTAGVNAFSCAVTTAWQRFGGVVDVPNNSKNLIVVIWTDTQFVAADSVSVSQASLTDGFEIQDWSPLLYEMELNRVRRFFWKSFDTDTGPVQNAGVNTGELKFVAGVAGAGAEKSPTFTLSPPVRLTPGTITFFNPAAANANARDETGAVDTTAIAGQQTANGIALTCTGNAATALNNLIGVHVTIDADM